MTTTKPTTNIQYAYLTGFEPFGKDMTKNRSWDTIIQLNNEQIAITNDHQNEKAQGQNYDPPVTEIIHCVTERLPVEYEPIPKLLMPKHRHGTTAISNSSSNDKSPVYIPPNKPFRYFVHCGAGVPGIVRIEVQAFKYGYFAPGNGGPTDIPPDNCVPGYPYSMLKTSVDVFGLVKYLQEEKKWGNDIVISQNAGAYLCEYTYYVSLAENQLKRDGVKTLVPKDSSDFDDQNSGVCCVDRITRYLSLASKEPSSGRNDDYNGDGDKASDPNALILFVHVPPSGGPYNDAQLAQIIRDILVWLNREYRKGNSKV
ncbi:Pyroglutamyl-peptidase 1 [Mycoemilia scoparia]|uniref:Pyroglutamyl-peptidase 1 n=1 Tax=Mycoemilia scoparia TaxID=417184 RepID=A0A9W8ACN5_9FUNG|nr:Pyroglutamyl-peptidase 1 [Mycoemilia scoparia]